MAYIRYKEITKHFNFSRAIKREELPTYINHYVSEDENVLACYETSRDHGVFTDKKIILFDNVSVFGKYKQVFTIPYKSISLISVLFSEKSAELNITMDCTYPMKLIFVNMRAEDKVRLRVLYNTIDRIINGEKPLAENLKRLYENDFSFKDKK